MSRPKSVYWIQTKRGPWGPFDWKLLRDWFALGWLTPETLVSEEMGGNWQLASAVERFWVKTKGTADKFQAFESLDLMSEKVPLSPALGARIQSLGWPGDLGRLKNYYWGNKLRETLENLFPDTQRPLFDDPAWPWSGGSPAEAERRADQRRHERLAGPPTSNQNEILQFFLGPHHGITSFREASLKTGQLLNDPQNKERWEAQPASPHQIARLQWASTRLHRPLPTSLTRGEAHELIDEWFVKLPELEEEFPDLEEEWQEEKLRRREEQEEKEMVEMEVSVISEDVDDWREFYNCKRVPKKKVTNVLELIGSRKQGEPINQFMNRFFTELRRQDPTLFSGQSASANKRPTRRGTGCMVMLSAGLLIFILCVLCIFCVLR
jgi:hypothetical protein